MLLDIEKYSTEAMTTREEAYTLACLFAEMVGSDLKPRKLKVSRDLHSSILASLGLKNKKVFSERAAVVAAIGCLNPKHAPNSADGIKAFMFTHQAKLSMLQWGCVSHKIASGVKAESLNTIFLKRWINEKTVKDAGVRAASLEALFLTFFPKQDIKTPLSDAQSLQFCKVAELCVSRNLSANQAFLLSIAMAETKTASDLLADACKILGLPMSVLKQDRSIALKTARKARNVLIMMTSEDRASESDRARASEYQKTVNGAFDMIENQLYPEIKEVNRSA